MPETEASKVKSSVLNERINNLTKMANDFVQIASSGGNVLEIPLKIEKFIPKRIGHVEHASVYKLDF